MKKLMIPLILVLILSMSGCGGEDAAGEEESAVPVPSLAELAGRYGDGAITFEKVHISEQLIAEAQKRIGDAEANADEDDPFDQIEVAGAGCDLAIIEALLAYEGQTIPNAFILSAVSETEGMLQFEAEAMVDDEEDAEPPEPLAFSYDPNKGTLFFPEVQEGILIANSLKASYLTDDKIEVSGTLRMTEEGTSESDFYMDLVISGTKPLDGK